MPVAHRDGRIEMRFHSNWKAFTCTAVCCLGIILNSQPGVSFRPKLTVHQHTVYKLPNLSLICPAVLCVWVNGALRKSLVLICAVLLLGEHWSEALATTSCWYYPFPESENNCWCVSDCVFDSEGCGDTLPVLTCCSTINIQLYYSILSKGSILDFRFLEFFFLFCFFWKVHFWKFKHSVTVSFQALILVYIGIFWTCNGGMKVTSSMKNTN